MITASYYRDELESRETERPYFYSASGYGRKIPTRHMVKLPGGKRWRRVYCCQISNAGTCYVLDGKNWVVID